jgi:hypothetical protein
MPVKALVGMAHPEGDKLWLDVKDGSVPTNSSLMEIAP